MCISSRCAHRTVCRQHRPSPSHRDATLQPHSQLYAAAQVPAFQDETSGQSRARGARAGGARVDRRRGARNGAARPRAVGALERLVLVLVVVSSPRSVELRMPPASRPAVVVVLSTADGIALPSGLHVRAAAVRRSHPQTEGVALNSRLGGVRGPSQHLLRAPNSSPEP